MGTDENEPCDPALGKSLTLSVSVWHHVCNDVIGVRLVLVTVQDVNISGVLS